MTASLSNVSFDGSPVQLRMSSPWLACFDPLLLDMLGELLPPGKRIDLARLLEDANVNPSALACFKIPDFQPGIYSLDPHDIKKFGDDETNLDYTEDEADADSPECSASYPFVTVDSGALILADVQQLPKLLGLLTWEQYDLGLQDESVFHEITRALGGPCFAVVYGGCLPGMEFDGDGAYTLMMDCLRPSGS